jgi:hypothetical protein
VKLESNGGDPRLLSLGLSGGSALTGGLDGVEGRDHVGWSNSGSRGGGSYRDSCLLLRLDLYAGDGRDQGAWSDGDDCRSDDDDARGRGEVGNGMSFGPKWIWSGGSDLG